MRGPKALTRATLVLVPSVLECLLFGRSKLLYRVDKRTPELVHQRAHEHGTDAVASCADREESVISVTIVPQVGVVDDRTARFSHD